MKRFVRDFFLTLFIGIAILTMADIFIPLETNEYSIKRDYINNHASEIQTLIIGNSLATNGIDAQVFGDSCYCFAISGRVLYYDMKLMEEYLSHMTNLKTVILPLHYNLHVYMKFDTTILRVLRTISTITTAIWEFRMKPYQKE